MKALICDKCGGTLTVDSDGINARCEFCGTEYIAETLQVKIQGVSHGLNVSKMPTVDNLIRKTETLLMISEYEKASILFEKVIDEYPDDARGWWGYYEVNSKYLDQSWKWLLEEGERYAKIAIKLDVTYQKKYDALWDEFLAQYKIMANTEQVGKLNLETINENDSYLLMKRPDELNGFPKIRALRERLLEAYRDGLLCGKIVFFKPYREDIISLSDDEPTLPDDLKSVVDEVLQKGFENAQEITKVNSHICLDAIKNDILGYSNKYEFSRPDNKIEPWNEIKKIEPLHEEHWRYNFPYFTKYYPELIFQLNNILYVRNVYYEEGNRYFMKYIIVTNKNYSPRDIIQLSHSGMVEKWKKDGKCQHCGGVFKTSFFKTKCTLCGKQKDY